MPEPAWAEGYVVDIGYTHGYYRELAPSALRFVTLLGGVRSPDPAAPFVYYELGCGNGHSTALHAAANPSGNFYGVDFNPMHIHHARRLAQYGGIGNAHFLETSFAELVEADLPEADMVVMHGVHSWISRENRAHIVEFLRRRLKPGGLVHVSYNCLPGLAQVAPLQRLLMEHAHLSGGALPERVRGALDFARRFEQTGAHYFAANPLAKARLAHLGGQDPTYLAHEYFNANWSPSYHADVARELAAAKLSYVGSAVIMDNFDQFVLKPEVTEMLAGIGDRTLAETLRDYARNQVFRRDVFARGAPRADAAELEATLSGTCFALLRPRPLCRLTGKTPLGEVTLRTEAYAPVLDALARAPMTLAELLSAPETAALDRVHTRQAVFGLAALGNLAVALPAAGEAERRAATDRYNAAILARPAAHPGGTMLASPVLGCGVPASLIDLLLLADTGGEDGAAERVMDALAAGGHKLQKDGKALEDRDELRILVEARTRSFHAAQLPFLRLAGVTG
ncbi:MAG TPA: class I SAM-dependent methyltransferase [Thiobacillaceae bacterium]|nr:class I SAM-dependent methyltransferase [Thiobacillaceae bacterium]